jgi:hypothetical protein
VIIKNIEHLQVKVFEFNTLTYYKKNLKPFNSSVNLDGLDAALTQEYKYEHETNILHREQFDFPNLKGAVGLFIVEIMGNGVSARAVIKKGEISLVHRSTIAGHMVYLLDEQKQICKGEKTGVWFDKQYYACKPEGHIFIPYNKITKTEPLIMIHNDFAQLSQLTQKTEDYDFSAFFYLHTGSVLVGANTNIVIRGKLNINGRPASLTNLKNVKLTLTTNNYIDNLPVTKTFNNLAFNNERELNVTFQVPPNLDRIHVDLLCEVANATTKQNEKFAEQHTFRVSANNSIDDRVMQLPYLRK